MNQKGISHILEIMGAYMHSKILLVSQKLGLFDAFRYEKATTKEIAFRIHIDLEMCTLLLNALYKLKFLLKEEDGYILANDSKEFLCSESENYIGDLIIFQENEWNSWDHLYETIKAGEAKAIEEEPMNEEEIKTYINGMNQVGKFTSKVVSTYVNLKGCNNFIDLGCGSGIFSIALKKKNPNVNFTLVDYKDVIDIAKNNVKENLPYDNSFQFIVGNYQTLNIDTKYDCAFLSQNIHEYSEEMNMKNFSKIFRMLKTGGKIVINDYVITDKSYFPDFFTFNMVLQKENAKCYTFKEIEKMLLEIGFVNITHIEPAMNIPSSLVIAEKM